MRLQTKPDESTSERKIPLAPQATEQPPAVQAESRSDRIENVAPTARREKAGSPKPLGNRVAGVLAVCATVFAAAALWQAPTESRFTPSGFFEGATRATEMVWYENVRIALAEKNLEAGRIDTAASLILASSPTQLHNETDLTAIRRNILLAAIRKSEWNAAIKLSIIQSPNYATSEFLSLFWKEAERNGKYARAREVVSKLPSSERHRLMSGLYIDFSIYPLADLSFGFRHYADSTSKGDLSVRLIASDLRELIRFYPDNRLLRWKEIYLERGQVSTIGLLEKLRLLEDKYPLKVNETDNVLEDLKNRLIQDLVEAGQVDMALSTYREMFPENSTTQKVRFVQHFAELFDRETLVLLLKDSANLLEKEITVLPAGNVKSLQFDTFLMGIKTLSRAILDSKKQNEISIQKISSRLNALEDRRKALLRVKRPDLH